MDYKLTYATMFNPPATLHERFEAALARVRGQLGRVHANFIKGADHAAKATQELRSPINNLRGMIEVALSKRRSGEAYRDVMESSLEECTRISRLIETLLFLARTDTARESLTREQVDVEKELAKVQPLRKAPWKLTLLSRAELKSSLGREAFSAPLLTTCQTSRGCASITELVSSFMPLKVA